VELLTVPPGVATSILPVAAPVGTVTLIFIDLSTLIVAGTPLKVTALALWRLDPLIVTTSPGAPDEGLKLVMIGGGVEPDKTRVLVDDPRM